MVNSLMESFGRVKSPIRQLFEYGKTLEKGRLIDLSLGNPSTRPPHKVLDTLSRYSLEAVHGYSSANGHKETRKAVADHLSHISTRTFDESSIFMTCGASGALCTTIKALGLGHDSQFIAIAPYFPEYRYFVTGLGYQFSAVEADYESFQINFDSLEKTIGPDTQAVIVNSPNNPSGSVLSSETLKKLASVLQSKSLEYGHTVYLISDEPYRELVYDGGVVPLPVDYYPNTIVCYSFSKSLSLPGDRIGYTAVSPDAQDRQDIVNSIAGSARCMGYVCAPTLMQAMISQCSDCKVDLETYQRNRDYFYNSLVGLGYRCVKPQGAFYLFFKAPNNDAQAFSEKAKEYGLLIVPSDDFGCKGYLRASFCVDYPVLEKAVSVLGKML